MLDLFGFNPVRCLLSASSPQGIAPLWRLYLWIAHYTISKVTIFWPLQKQLLQKAQSPATCFALKKPQVSNISAGHFWIPPNSKDGWHFNRLNCNNLPAFPRDDAEAGSRSYGTFATGLHRLSIKTVWKPCLIDFDFILDSVKKNSSSVTNTGTVHCVVTRIGARKPCLAFPTTISEEASLCTFVLAPQFHPAKHLLSSVEIMIYSWI